VNYEFSFIDDLHKVILQWDYTTLYLPLNTDLKRVPHFFNSIDEYIEVFEPLLLEELRAQLEKAKEDEICTASLFLYRLNIYLVGSISYLLSLFFFILAQIHIIDHFIS
jgi:hypothetical protein